MHFRWFVDFVVPENAVENVSLEVRLCFYFCLVLSGEGYSFGCGLKEDGGCVERSGDDGQQKGTDKG